MDSVVTAVQQTQTIAMVVGLVILLLLESAHPFFDFFREAPRERGRHALRNLLLGGLNAGLITLVFVARESLRIAATSFGIAIGAGTDVAVETADIVLVRSNPKDVAAILKLSRATYQKMIQNLWWAAGYNIIAIPVAAGVLYGLGILLVPAVGAGLMSLSTVIVALNARRLKMGR